MIQDLDANGDGKVTLGEFTAKIAKHFAAQTVTPEQKAVAPAAHVSVSPSP